MDEALQRAYASRSDYQAAMADVRAAELSRKAAVAGYFPRSRSTPITAWRDPILSTATQVFDVRGTLIIPIFQGGIVRGEILQADARLDQTRERLDNLHAQIDADVRAALLNLQSSADQVDVARSNIDLAEETLDAVARPLQRRRHRYRRSGAIARDGGQRARAIHLEPLQLQSRKTFSGPRTRRRRNRALSNSFKENKMADDNPDRSTPGAANPTPARTIAPLQRRLAARYRKPRRRRNTIILVVVLVAVIIGGIFLWRYFNSYESTDDAQADVHLYPVSARVSGHVIKVNVDDNQWVEQGTVLVEIDPKDYEVAVAQAQASLASAEATAQSLNITVPITSITTTSQLASASSDVDNANSGIVAYERQLTAAQAQLEAAEANDVQGASRSRALQNARG